MNILRWICGLAFLTFMSTLIVKTGINAINLLLAISAFVFLIDAILYKKRSL